MEGAVEVARTHLADAIQTLLTGNTLVSNGLQEQDIILESQAVIIQNNKMQDDLRPFVTKCWLGLPLCFSGE